MVAGDLSTTAESVGALSLPEPTRLLVATLQIRLNSRKMKASNQVLLVACGLRDGSVAKEFKREQAESLGEPVASDDPEILWLDFKINVLKVSSSCLRDTPGTSKSFSDQGDPQHHRGESQG